MSPFFSVVIPVHNKRPHVHRSVSSVLSQAYDNFEVIIIDDASTDGSFEEIQKFDDERIRIFRRKTPGPGGYAARNLGIRESKGEWVAFLDADDEWNHNHLRKTFDGIKKYPDADMLSCGWLMSDGRKTIANKYYKQNISKGEHYFDISDYLKGSKPVWTSIAIIKKTLLLNSGGFDESWNHGADQELWLRLLLTEKAKGLWLPYLGATYHMDSVNMVTSDMNQVYSPTTNTIRKYLSDNNLNSDLSKSLKRYANGKALNLIQNKIDRGGCDKDYLRNIAFYDVLSSKRRIFFYSLELLPQSAQKILMIMRAKFVSFRNSLIKRVIQK